MRRQKVISTKHIPNAPKRLLKFENLSERLTKWLEILGAYDFEFEHCPGLHHCNADLQFFLFRDVFTSRANFAQSRFKCHQSYSS